MKNLFAITYNELTVFSFAANKSDALNEVYPKVSLFFDSVIPTEMQVTELTTKDADKIRYFLSFNFAKYQQHIDGIVTYTKKQLSVLRGFGNLLTIDSNAKTVKGRKQGYMTGISYMLPSDHLTKETVCPISKNCKKDCLAFSGRLKFDRNQFTLLLKKIFYLDFFNGWNNRKLST